MIRENYQKGMTLVELIVSMTILSLIMASFVSSFIIQQRNSTRQQDYVQLIQRGRATVQYIEGRFREIGYDPVMAGGFGLTTADKGSIAFTADHNANGHGPDDSVSFSLNGRSLILRDFNNPGTGSIVADEIDSIRFQYQSADGTTLAPLPLTAIQRAAIKSIRVSMTLRRATNISSHYPITVNGFVYLRN